MDQQQLEFHRISLQAQDIRERIRAIEGELASLAPDVRDAPRFFRLGRQFDEMAMEYRSMERHVHSNQQWKQELHALSQEIGMLRSRLLDALSPLFEAFFKKYQVQLGDSKRKMNSVFAVRHEVYCRELGFEPATTSAKEIDPYDPQSEHVLLATTEEPDRAIGCMRVVFLDPLANIVSNDLTPRLDLLPLESVCTKFGPHRPSEQPRERICEISRLTLLSDYRTTAKRTAQKSASEPSQKPRADPLSSLVTLALPLAAYAVTLHHKVLFAYQLACRISLHYAWSATRAHRRPCPISRSTCTHCCHLTQCIGLFQIDPLRLLPIDRAATLPQRNSQQIVGFPSTP